MRTTQILVTFGIAVLMTGCVPTLSLHPLFTDKDSAFDPALLGAWAETESSEDTFIFQRSQDKANGYELTISENGVPARFEARLVRLGDHAFLDVAPQVPDLKNETYLLHLLPFSHTFSRIRVEGDVLRVATLKSDWVKEMIDRKKVKIGHQSLEDVILLTAPTETLRKFAMQYAENDQAFSITTELHRRK